MRVLVTGATGFIGSAVVRELLETGHEVVGLARSDAAAESLRTAGAQVHRGDLEDLDGLRAAADAAEGVIHTAYVHDFSNIPAAAQTDRRAIETLGRALVGSDRPFIVSAGTALLAPGRPLSEQDAVPESTAHPRVSEQVALPFAEQGVHVSVVRLPPSVHGEGDHGFVPHLINVARAKGVSAYVGDGSNRWPAVHRADAARVFRLALENAPAGTRVHAIADEGVPFREIAETIGRHSTLPVTAISREEADSHFEWFALFASMDVPASSVLTQKQLDWRPEQPGLIADLDEGHYFTG